MNDKKVGKKSPFAKKIRKLFPYWSFRWRYIRGWSRWDTGVPHPKLIDFLEGHKPGTAIDLGCGSGTNAIAMAKYGWQVVGIDFIPEAIRSGQTKAEKTGVAVDLRVGDVTKQDDLNTHFDLAIDIGCYHSLSPELRPIYRKNLKQILAPEGDFLIYALDRPVEEHPPGITESDIDGFADFMDIQSREDGSTYRGRPSFWLHYKK